MSEKGVEITGLDQVLKRLERSTETMRKAAMRGLKKGGMDIIADAQQNLRANGSVVTGYLRQTGRIEEETDKSLSAGFFGGTAKGESYAYFVEYGRKAGKFPANTEERLTQWAKKKFGLSDKDAKRMGFLVARKIARKGSKAHPFFQPALEKNKKKILEEMRRALKQATNK